MSERGEIMMTHSRCPGCGQTIGDERLEKLEAAVDAAVDALERIAALANVTEVRGELENMATPAHLVDEEGWGPIHPRMKQGLDHAAHIALDALATLDEHWICPDCGLHDCECVYVLTDEARAQWDALKPLRDRLAQAWE